MPPKPTVLLVIEGTYPWYRGGVSEWVHQYVNAFTDVDFHIVQIATDEFRRSDFADALYPVPSHITAFHRTSPPVTEFNGIQEQLYPVSEVEDEILSLASHSDCIHVANTGFAGLLGSRLAIRFDKPLILTEHALYWKEVSMGAVALECGYKIPARKNDKQKTVDLFKEIACEVYRTADTVISVSNCNLENQKELGADDPLHIPNGVEQSWLRPEKKRSDRPTIGWIGRCANMKNPLKFLKLAVSTSEQASFIMMLCDSNEPGLKKRVVEEASRIDNLTLIWNRPAIEHIDEMDALCITSNNESQPLVLFEALSRKVLPFGWEVGDVGSRYAMVFDPEMPVETAGNQICALWENSARWQEELEKRYTLVSQQHTWEHIFDRYRTIFKSYLKLENDL